MRTKIKAAVAVVVGTLGVVSAVQLGAPAPASAAPNPGCTTLRNGVGIVCATVDATSPESINSFGGRFDSSVPLVRPRLRSELLDERGKVLRSVEQTWQNDRLSESVNKPVNQSIAGPPARVCTTVFEAGQNTGTACVYTPSAGQPGSS